MIKYHESAVPIFDLSDGLVHLGVEEDLSRGQWCMACDRNPSTGVRRWRRRGHVRSCPLENANCLSCLATGEGLP